MRLRYIELFHAIVTTGSLTGAANLLNISQPAASKALQQAEQHLGFTLFSRVRGRLQPTSQALLLRPRIDKVMHDLEDLHRLTENIKRPESCLLRVTCTPALAQSLVPDTVVALREALPGTTAELLTQHSAVMRESLLLHEVDIGLTLQDTGHQNLRQEALCRGRVMVIAPPGWWSDEELSQPLPVAALAGETMVGIAVRDALGGVLHGHLAQLDPKPKVPVRVQTYQLAHSLVAQGEGLALVDPFTARWDGRHSVQTRPLKLQLDVVLYAVYRLDSPLDAVQKRFLGIVKRLARQMLASP